MHMTKKSFINNLQGREGTPVKLFKDYIKMEIDDEDMQAENIGTDALSSIDEEVEKLTSSRRYNKWTQDGVNYIPTGHRKTVTSLPCGIYRVDQNPEVGRYMVKDEVYTDDILNLPLPQIQEILEDIAKFWESKPIFDEYGYAHKRGILMHGKAGCGKSGAIQLIIKDLIKVQKGIVIKVEDPEDLRVFKGLFSNQFRMIEPDRKVVVIIEDIDGLVESKAAESLLLNLLDGINQSQNIVYLATTNYPNKLKERITNRPSRFDRRYEFSYPNEEVREYYFKNKVHKKDIKRFGGMGTWLEKTEKLTLAHLRELIISTVILGNDFDETIERLHDMNNAMKASDTPDSGIGFGFGKKS